MACILDDVGMIKQGSEGRGPHSRVDVAGPADHIEVAEVQKAVSERLDLRTLQTEVDEAARCDGRGDSLACP